MDQKRCSGTWLASYTTKMDQKGPFVIRLQTYQKLSFRIEIFKSEKILDHVSLKISWNSPFNFISNKKRCSGCPYLNNIHILMVLRCLHANIIPSIIKIRDERSVEDRPGRNLIFNWAPGDIQMTFLFIEN